MNIPEVKERMIMDCHMKTNHIKNFFQLKPVKPGNIKEKGGYYY